MKRLVLFGDSLFGRFGKELINKLEDRSSCDVYNCAAGGWNTEDGARKSFFIASLKPDFIVISFGLNDSAPGKQIPLENFEENINEILKNFKSSKIIFFLPPPVNENKEQGDIKRLNDIEIKYYKSAKDICLQNNVEVIDLWDFFIKLQSEKKDYHIDDGVHINDFGYEIFINKLVEIISRSKK